MKTRESHNTFDKPISIYEVHLGSWRRKGTFGENYLTYREFADYLVPYVLNMGFTHVEFLPLCEHPLDAVSDGEPTDYGWEQAAEECIKAQQNKKVIVHAIGTQGANCDIPFMFSGS